MVGLSQDRYGAPAVGLIKIAAGVTPGHPRLFPRCPSLEHLAAKHPGIVYARIIGAIADGTDTPSLRRALLSLESEKVELESAMAMYHRPAFVEPPPVPDLEKLFRRKVEMLEQSLGDDPTITTQAATILRALIEGIVLHPRKKRGSGKKRATMSIEVYGEPSALFLLDNDEASDGGDRMLTVVAEEVCLIALY